MRGEDEEYLHCLVVNLTEEKEREPSSLQAYKQDIPSCRCVNCFAPGVYREKREGKGERRCLPHQNKRRRRKGLTDKKCVV